MADSWPVQAGEGQVPSLEPWATWLVLGGRGSGKTRCGAEWLCGQLGPRRRLALIGPTIHDVREVMIGGPSGLLTVPCAAGRPSYQPSRKRLVWPNGAVAYAFSAEDPESLRGPQFHTAWADEFCAWPKPAETLAQIRLGLRLGRRPQLMVTTTPKPIPALKQLMREASTGVERVATAKNAANLAPEFLSGLRALYGGTRLEAQELDGRVVEAREGALWRAAELARCRGAAPPSFERIVVAVDPPASDGGAACGIVVAGRLDGRGYVLDDRSARGLSPLGWAAQAADAARDWGADAVVAEANQGGDMVRTVLGVAQCPAPIKLVHARVGKRARAEPVAALYEQGRVTHCGPFPALEEEMMALGAEAGGPSPDRADALVWALTELLLGGDRPAPRIRIL